MIKTPELEELCGLLYEHPPDWISVAVRLKKSNVMFSKKSSRMFKWKRFLSEVHIDLALEKIDKENPHLEINLLPIEDKGQTDYYRFQHTQLGRYFISVREENRSRSQKTGHRYEYDRIIKVKKLPVIFEIKSGKWVTIRESLKREKLIKKLMPVRQFFGRDVGYVFVIPKNLYLSRENNPDMQSAYNTFKRNGGLVVPLYTTKEDFETEIPTILSRLNFRFTGQGKRM